MRVGVDFPAQPRRAAAVAACVLVAMVAVAATPLRAQRQVDPTDPRGVERATVRQALDRVFSRPEYQKLLPSPGERQQALDSEESWLEKMLRQEDSGRSGSSSSRGGPGAFSLGGGLGSLLLFLLYGLVAAILVAVLILILRAVTLRRRGHAGDIERPFDATQILDEAIAPGERAPSEYAARAREAAREGDYRQAIGLLLLGAMSWTERGGWIRHRVGLTNRDYVRALWKERSARDGLLSLSAVFDEVHFGRREATESRYRQCLVRFTEVFDAQESRHAV